MKASTLILSGWLLATASFTQAADPPALERDNLNAGWADRVTLGGEQAKPPAGRHTLWYRQPAKVWEEALPIGNGRLGAMIFGGITDERLQLNEDSLWDGYPLDTSNPNALKALPEVRKRLFEGKNKEAEQLASANMMGRPQGVKPYQSLGALLLEFPGSASVSAYCRTLDVTTAVTNDNGILTVSEADSVTLLIAGATSYRGGDPEQLCQAALTKAAGPSYDELKATSIADHRNLFDRVAVDLGSAGAEVDALPTNERLGRIKQGQPDPGLVATYFQFGRYLLISSSRPGCLPANLQGIWAWQMNPPWNADFHTNINVQMNYWLAEITNLSECHLPLFDLMDGLVKPGGRVARVHYGARGWVVHHLTDPWGFATPADGLQGIWPVGSAWLAEHPFEHYQFTGDKEFLAKRGWPLMEGAARFILDFLVEAPAGTPVAGKRVTNPSYSPENAFLLPDGKTRAVFTYGATMDLMIVHELLTNCISASKILDTDADFRRECEAALAKLAPVRISPTTGRILEWIDDYQECEPHHRHTSHLYGLHPSNMITSAPPGCLMPRARFCWVVAMTAPAGASPGRSTCGPASTTATTPSSC